MPRRGASPSSASRGRSVPGLYLLGWIATVMGLGVLLVSFLAAGNAAAPWLFLVGLLVVTVGAFAATGSQAVENGRRTDLAYRGPSPVLVFLVVFPVTLIGILVVLAPLSALGLDVRSPGRHHHLAGRHHAGVRGRRAAAGRGSGCAGLAATWGWACRPGPRCGTC